MRKLFFIPFILLVSAGCLSDEERINNRVERIHKSIMTVDTHCDTPMRMARHFFDLGKRHDDGCIDFIRMKEGGLNAEFFGVFTSQGPRTQEESDKVYQKALAILDSIHASVDRNKNISGLALSPEDAKHLWKEGKIAAFIGVENGYPIGTDLSRVENLYKLGARYITLCHSFNNDICDSSTDPAGPEHNGLSQFGVSVVHEMNRLGMMVDVSHMSDKSFYDVLQVTKAPVIASHSSCRALCESPRNFTDDMLLALKKNGGVIQICILSSYLKQPEPNPEFDTLMMALKDKWKNIGHELTEDEKEQRWNEISALRDKYEKLATVEDAVNHIQHVVNVIGADYVGIGTDFDGGGGIDGCRNVAQMKNITRELVRRGFSKEDIAKIWGGNAMRVLSRAEAVSREMQAK
ncbi:MAG TPA: dipeptidase [Bacteroidales bacterium]|nr:dipeptidase [Bacteroidales bacterium]